MAYQDLDSERHEIRLLTISDDESPVITYTLCTVSLLDEPSFKAVSYSWGVESADRKLVLDGEEMEVMVNLDLLLRQFRHERHGPLYVDALCIYAP
jgi:Heterokaryon incompatibility protein (HET)